MEFQVDLLTFIVICLCIISETHDSSALYGGVIGGVVGVLIIVVIILGIVFFLRKKDSICNHLLDWTGTIYNFVLSSLHLGVNIMSNQHTYHSLFTIR